VVLGVFTALHAMQTETRSSDENSLCLSVCLSVCLSNACIVTKQKKDLSRFLYHTKERLMGATSSTWNLGSSGASWSEIADFQL